jgi:hypothetical protein
MRQFRKHWRLALVAVAVLAVAGAGVGIAIGRQHGGRAHAKLLNEPTRAREVRPLSTQPDDRFAPLPLERERH